MNSNGVRKSNQDLSLISELKVIWDQYGHYPCVRRIFGNALADGQITPMELNQIRATIGMALVKDVGGWEAFLKTKPDPKWVGEIEQIKERFEPGSEPAKALEHILSDGVVTKEEMNLLRSICQSARVEQSMGPKVRVPTPKAPQPYMEGRVKRKDEEED